MSQKIVSSFSEVRILSLFLVILFCLIIPKEPNPQSSEITVTIPADIMWLTKFNTVLWVSFNILLQLLAKEMYGEDNVSSCICTEVCILNLRLWGYLSLKYELTANEMLSHA